MAKRNNVEVVDHIHIPYSAAAEKILFDEQIKHKYEIWFRGEYKITLDVSKKLRSELSDNGFEFRPKDVPKLVPKKMYNGTIPITIIKNYEKKQLVEYVIVVQSASQDEFYEKRKLIVASLKELIPGIKPEYVRSDKFIDCKKSGVVNNGV